MTCIAFDGRFVASDTLYITNGRKSFISRPKIVEKNGIVYGTTGFDGLIDEWIKWYEGDQDPKETPAHGHCDNDTGTFIVFKDGKCFVYTMIIPYPIEEVAPVAFGSGGDFAIAAMMAGANAERAVEIASRLDKGCGGEITVVDLQDLLSLKAEAQAA